MSESAEILRYFDPRLFSADLKSTTKEEVLREMTTLLCHATRVRTPEVLLEMLRGRESLGSTGIGNGVAIPHGRSLAIGDLRVLFARSARGVEFDAIDGQPVHLFFLIVAPPQDQKNEYLPLLGKIVELLKEEKIRGLLRKVEDFSQLRAALSTKTP